MSVEFDRRERGPINDINNYLYIMGLIKVLGNSLHDNTRVK